MRRAGLIVTDFSLGFEFVVNDNVELNSTWSQFETPIVQYTTIDSDGYGEGPLAIFFQTWFLTSTRLFFSSRRVERDRIPSPTHGRLWTDKVPRSLPSVR
jgi:hypothetical protein